MTLILISFIIMLIAIAGLSIGILANRRPLAGSCGGASERLNTTCYANCDKPCNKRQQYPAEPAAILKRRRS